MADDDVTWERDYQLNIPLGSLVKVFWTGEKRWFFGVIDETRREDGKRIHHVTYKDGDKKWHHLPSEWWLQVKDVAKEKAEKAAAKAAANAAAAFAAAAEKQAAVAKKAKAKAAAAAATRRRLRRPPRRPRHPRPAGRKPRKSGHAGPCSRRL